MNYVKVYLGLLDSKNNYAGIDSSNKSINLTTCLATDVELRYRQPNLQVALSKSW